MTGPANLTDLIGDFSELRPACTDSHHLAATYNARMNSTWCWCGAQQWSGSVPTVHARWIYDGPGEGAKLLGYDVYTMAALPAESVRSTSLEVS